MSLPQPLLDTLGATVTRTEAMTGGDLSQVARITLDDGREMVTKRGTLVDAEARMLATMALVRAPVPQVLHAEHGLICIEYLPPAPATAHAWRDFGAALAKMHSWDGQDYGWSEDYAFGDVRIENGAAPSWPAFWGERRLLPFLPHLPAAIGARIEALVADLGTRLPRAPNPALLHGDLWGGNVHFTDQGAYMIDPASYYGHSEVDLAMLTLFGQPDAAFWRGYGHLEPGFEARRVIYQLFPALVHLRLFGESYAPMVTRLLDEAGV